MPVSRTTVDDEPLVAIIGLTGAGKSTFINIAAADEPKLPIGHELTPQTEEIQPVRAVHPDSRRVVLIDTPGLDSTESRDQDISQSIFEWMTKNRRENAKLAGIIYLHRITDNRMTTDPHQHFGIFSHLCGDNGVRNVTLVTTMWGHIKDKADLAQQREKELRDKWWRTMLNCGSSIERFDDTFESAWTAIGVAIRGAPPDDAALQEGLYAFDGRLSTTEPGKMLYERLQRLIASRDEALWNLREGVKKTKYRRQVQKLNEGYEKIQEELLMVIEELHKLKLPSASCSAPSFQFSEAVTGLST